MTPFGWSLEFRVYAARDRLKPELLTSEPPEGGTPNDMHAERDHLVTVVFPELRERVEQLELKFFDVDLGRKGRRQKEECRSSGSNGETANSWEYCRQWIDRVEPFFVCILGQSSRSA